MTRPIVLVLILVGIGFLIVFWAFAGYRGSSAEVVRTRMHADLRAGRLAECRAALAWLEFHGGLTSQDAMVRARIEQLAGRPDLALNG